MFAPFLCHVAGGLLDLLLANALFPISVFSCRCVFCSDKQWNVGYLVKFMLEIGTEESSFLKVQNTVYNLKKLSD